MKSLLRFLQKAILLFSFISMGTPALAALRAGVEGAENEANVFSTQNLTPFDGAQITRIHIEGLQRTSERAVRLLLGVKEGDAFTKATWIYGIKKLYNTSVLYDLKTEIKEIPPSASDSTPQRQIEITLSLKDKWTLVPFASAQGGGGSSILGGGLYDSNLGGYFTQVTLGIASYNGAWMYDINQYQEWFLDTDFIFGVDISRIGIPISIQNQGGEMTQNFTWGRSQQQLLLGERLGQNFRAFSYLEIFQDNLIDGNAGASSQIYTQIQYRLRPTLISGRSNLTNYLEEGYELKIAPTSANFLNPQLSYHQLVMSYKKTSILPYNSNLAFFISSGIMTNAPLPYEFRLGGLDSVRGFSTNRFIGTLYTFGNLEFRPTLFTHRFSWAPLDLVALQACAFIDSGWIQGKQDPTSSPSSLGLLSAGLGLRLIFVKYSNAVLRMDWAQALSPSEGLGFSFGIGQFF